MGKFETLKESMAKYCNTLSKFEEDNKVKFVYKNIDEKPTGEAYDYKLNTKTWFIKGKEVGFLEYDSKITMQSEAHKKSVKEYIPKIGCTMCRKDIVYRTYDEKIHIKVICPHCLSPIYIKKN